MMLSFLQSISVKMTAHVSINQSLSADVARAGASYSN
jgi:hypothetical protein